MAPGTEVMMESDEVLFYVWQGGGTTASIPLPPFSKHSRQGNLHKFFYYNRLKSHSVVIFVAPAFKPG
jgi:hypothetical protein